MKNGYTLVELLIAVSLVALLSVGVVDTYISFQRQAILDRATSEIVTALQVARTKSVNGQLKDGTTVADYYDGTGNDPASLPVYGVRFLTANTYAIVASYKNAGGTAITDQSVEPHIIDSSLTLTTTPTLPMTEKFARTTGDASPMTITLQRKTFEGKTITISSNGTLRVASL